MIDVKRGRELLAKATEPGKPWSTSHRADGTASIYTSGPGPLRGIIDVAETRSNDADLTVWLHNNAEALLSAAERVEEAQRVLHAVAESMSEHAYQELASALEAPPRIDVASQSDKLTAAERRVAELEAKNAQLAHEGEVLGALYVGDAPPKDAARAIVERAQAAERARDEALRRAEAAEAVLGRTRRRFTLTRRWPCPFCGRAEGEPLRIIGYAPDVDGNGRPTKVTYWTGCSQCTDIDLTLQDIATLDPKGGKCGILGCERPIEQGERVCSSHEHVLKAGMGITLTTLRAENERLREQADALKHLVNAASEVDEAIGYRDWKRVASRGKTLTAALVLARAALKGGG